MSQQIPPDFSDPTRATFTHLSALIHLFHHRNRNQHRHSLWYRHFAQFRRQLTRFHADLTAFHAPAATHLARTRQKAARAALIARQAARRTCWRDEMVPRWHRAFAQVLADQRFAVLGVVLLAMLAEMCAALGLTAEMEAERQREVQAVLAKFAREEWGDSEGGVVGKRKRMEADDDGKGEDVGEVMTRQVETEGDEEGVTMDSLPNDVAAHESTARIKPERKVKKKRKKGNAIDDLFSGLG